MLCVSDIVESIGPLARSEGAPRSPRRVCTCVRSPRSTDRSADFNRVDDTPSLSSEPSPARPFARRAARSATIVPVVSRRPSTAAIVAGSVPAAAVGTIIPSIATTAPVGPASAAASPASVAIIVAEAATGTARASSPLVVEAHSRHATAAATAATAAIRGNGAIPPRHGVFHEIERLEALVPVRSEDEHEFVAIVDVDVLRLGDEAKGARLALDRPEVLRAVALEAPGGAAGDLQLGDVVATLGGDGERAAALLQQPVEVIPTPLALVAIARHDRHGTDVLENRAGCRRELLTRGTLSRWDDERGKGQREVLRDDPSAGVVNVRIDKGASTPRDGIQARGDEPENIRKTSDSMFAYGES